MIDYEVLFITSISVGVAELGEHEMKFQGLLYRADLALYRDKQMELLPVNHTHSYLSMEDENGISF